MSYLDRHPTFTRQTGSTLENWQILYMLHPEHMYATGNGLAALAQHGCLDAVTLMPAGSMTSTGLGSVIPVFIERDA